MTRKEFFAKTTGVVAGALGISMAIARFKVSPPEIQEVPKGKLYAIEFPNWLSAVDHRRVHEELAGLEKQFGCSFMVLDGGARLVNAENQGINREREEL